MNSKKLLIVCANTLAIAPGSMLAAQAQTNVPDAVPGAKPVTVEHIKLHGKSLEGNLEGDAVDRDVACPIFCTSEIVSVAQLLS